MGRIEKERACLALSEAQFGCISIKQALRCGLSRSGIARRLRARFWLDLRPGVYAIRGAPETWHRSLMAATLWAGDDSAISHRSAAKLWGLEGFAQQPLEMVVMRDLRSCGPREIFHRVGDLPRGEVRRVAGIPVTSMERTICDLASVLDIDPLEEALDEALRTERVQLKALNRRLQSMTGRGHTGIANLRALIKARLKGEGFAESRLESRLFSLLREAGLPLPRKQFRVMERNLILARIDLAYPEIKLSIEADGYRYHSGRQAWQRDIERRTKLTSRGWRILHFSWDDVHQRPEHVAEEVARALVG